MALTMTHRCHLFLALIIFTAALEWRTISADYIDELEDYLEKNGGCIAGPQSVRLAPAFGHTQSAAAISPY
jgi:hypothetical protein